MPKPAPNASAPSASKAVSLNPDNMIRGGLKDDFDGLITKARFVPWDYNGTREEVSLAVAITIKPDDEDEPFIQHYTAGKFEAFQPSNDGNEAIGIEGWKDEGADLEAYEGTSAVRVGAQTALSSTSNFGVFLAKAIEAGFDQKKMTSEVTFLEGVYGHFNRLVQKPRSGIVNQRTDASGAARPSEVLCLTEVKEAPKGATKAAPAKASAPKAGPAAKTATAPAAAAGGDLDTALTAIVAGAVAGTEGITKKSLASIALKVLPGAMKAKGVKRVMENEFLEGGGDGAWIYDVESETLYPGE